MEDLVLDSDVFDLPVDTFPVVVLPEGFSIIGSTARVHTAVAIHPESRWLGLQFHPEMEHSLFGSEILRYCVTEFCHLPISVNDGGVDFTTAVGKRMHPVYVDTELMRPGTKEKVSDIFTNHVDANDRFMQAMVRKVYDCILS